MSATKPPSPPAQPDPLDEALEETFPASDPISIDPPREKPEPADKAKKHDSPRHHGKH
ncbi:Flagellar hook-length control protein fliK [Paraburkholderia tropica]|uniref:hypothetical protein n=1 Tax=Paraburkholderia tropica TaxID=92647 RepID=UPI001CB2C8D5|nr:hypothetical protein [Paraburkholderia tropica]CAG9195394.1 Flagellar hook-length control protein fliK [Paraburkholderia tropica]